jgi:hypothetical protein
MGLVRRFAVQGHEVPKTSYRAHGPFSPEVLAQTRVVHDDSHSDSLHEALDDVRMFRCRYCGEIVYEDEISIHECKEEN